MLYRALLISFLIISHSISSFAHVDKIYTFSGEHSVTFFKTGFNYFEISRAEQLELYVDQILKNSDNGDDLYVIIQISHDYTFSNDDAFYVTVNNAANIPLPYYQRNILVSQVDDSTEVLFLSLSTTQLDLVRILSVINTYVNDTNALNTLRTSTDSCTINEFNTIHCLNIDTSFTSESVLSAIVDDEINYAVEITYNQPGFPYVLKADLSGYSLFDTIQKSVVYSFTDALMLGSLSSNKVLIFSKDTTLTLLDVNTSEVTNLTIPFSEHRNHRPYFVKEDSLGVRIEFYPSHKAIQEFPCVRDIRVVGVPISIRLDPAKHEFDVLRKFWPCGYIIDN